MDDRPSTPPPPAAASRPGVIPKSPLTPEQVKRLEINRLKAKALREQHDATAHHSNPPPSLNHHSSSRLNNNNVAAGSKRPASAISSTTSIPSSSRDARSTTPAATTAKPPTFRPLDTIQPARSFQKFVEYDFSKMTDTKGGFMTAEDDPHNRALHRPGGDEDEKPGHMTMKEWERHQLLRKLREARQGPFEPGLSVLDNKAGRRVGGGESSRKRKVCQECESPEIDFLWDEVLHCAVCGKCKEEMPEKYSLLTKTEAKQDYLLTDPELRDEELLPHLERPNPHKSTWNNMMLYLRYQVEEYALGPQKWGSGERLDEEFARREGEKKRRKEDKFKSKLDELKKKTRVEAWRRGRANGKGGGAFGDEVGGGGKHRHVWGRAVDGGEEGEGVKKCVECGMEVEELEF